MKALIPNPSFDSQTKETLKTKETEFEKLLELPEEFLKKIEKSAIVDYILEKAQMRTKMAVMKHGGSKKKFVNVEKLVDANQAGGINY